MKKIIKLSFFLVLGGFFLTSCDKDDDDYYLNANFKSVFYADMDAATSIITANDTMLNYFNTSTLLYPSSDANFWYYRYVISAVEINNVVLKVTSTNSDFTLNDGTLSFFTLSNDTTIVSKESIYTEWTLGETPMNLGKTLIFSNSDNKYDDIFKLLTAFRPFGVSFTGNTEQENVQFSVEVLISAYVWINY